MYIVSFTVMNDFTKCLNFSLLIRSIQNIDNYPSIRKTLWKKVHKKEKLSHRIGNIFHIIYSHTYLPIERQLSFQFIDNTNDFFKRGYSGIFERIGTVMRKPEATCSKEGW